MKGLPSIAVKPYPSWMPDRVLAEKARELLKTNGLSFHTNYCLEAAIEFENHGHKWISEQMLKFALQADNHSKGLK